MISGFVVLLSFALLVGCGGRASKFHLNEIEIDSLEDTTRSEGAIRTYLDSRSLSHSLQRSDAWGYDEIFAPTFLRGIPGYLFLGYSSRSRSDSTPKIGFSWVANDVTFALVGDSIRQKGFDNISFGSRKERFDTLAVRLAALFQEPFESHNPFLFNREMLVLMQDSTLSIDLRAHRLAR